MDQLKFAQDLIKTDNKSVAAGFNMFIMGFQKITFADGYSDAFERIQGYEYAEQMAKEKGIAFTRIFKCDSKATSCFPFQYGGSFVCNNCGLSDLKKKWWEIKVVKDGDAYCCHGLDFEDLQSSSNYAFGNTFDEAIDNYETLMLK